MKIVIELKTYSQWNSTYFITDLILKKIQEAYSNATFKITSVTIKEDDDG